MNKKLLKYCKTYINELLNEGLIRPSKSLWYVLPFMFKMKQKLNEKHKDLS